MQFEILDVFQQDSQLVVKVRHHNPDGSAWFVEHYTWQGREGLKRKRATNALGQLLLDDGTVAPTEVVRRGPPDKVSAFLPAGRTWLLRPGPHMDESSILSIIRSVHQQRRITGWPQGKVDNLPVFKHNTSDNNGVEILRTKFQGLIGRQE